MFPKAWQAVAFVGFVLVFVVFVFGGEGEPAGMNSAVEAAERTAAQRDGADGEVRAEAPNPAPAPVATVSSLDEFYAGGGAAGGGFADHQIEEYDAGKAAAPTGGPSSRASSRAPSWTGPLPKGPPPPGARDPSKAPPRIIPQDPSSDPDLMRDLDAALKRQQG